MSLLKRLFGARESDPRLRLAPLYQQVVAHAREPHWYLQGQVPDTVDGRFDMVAAILTLVILRLEQTPGHEADMAYLTELFVDDMDGQLRQVGIGEMIVGKHVGRLVGALGGRLTVFRPALAGEGDLDGAILRNIYRADSADEVGLAHVRERLLETVGKLSASDAAQLAAGEAIW